MALNIQTWTVIQTQLQTGRRDAAVADRVDARRLNGSLLILALKAVCARMRFYHRHAFDQPLSPHRRWL